MRRGLGIAVCAAALLIAAGCPGSNNDAATAQGLGDLLNQAIDQSYPAQAHLWIYICPDFADGGCTPSPSWQVGSQCSFGGTPTPGSCFDTGATVAPGGPSSIAGCANGCGTCGNSSSFTAPAQFVDPNYFPGLEFYCKTACTAPASCP